jgi:hypothetical protein
VTNIRYQVSRTCEPVVRDRKRKGGCHFHDTVCHSEMNRSSHLSLTNEKKQAHWWGLCKALFDCDYKLDCWPDCSQIVARLFSECDI